MDPLDQHIDCHVCISEGLSDPCYSKISVWQGQELQVRHPLNSLRPVSVSLYTPSNTTQKTMQLHEQAPLPALKGAAVVLQASR